MSDNYDILFWCVVCCNAATDFGVSLHYKEFLQFLLRYTFMHFMFHKLIFDTAFSCSFGKRNAEKCKDFENQTRYRWGLRLSNFYYMS